MKACPFCKKGFRLEDRIVHQGNVVVADYCSWCGKNWPKDQIPTEPAPKVTPIEEWR